MRNDPEAAWDRLPRAGPERGAAAARLRRVARLALRVLLTALALALLGQAFTAGVAAVTNPEWWDAHRAWVHIFQWLVVPIPFAAVLADVPRGLKWASPVPLVLIGLQYVLVHRAISGALPLGFGMHAVSALILFGVTVLLAMFAWR